MAVNCNVAEVGKTPGTVLHLFYISAISVTGREDECHPLSHVPYQKAPHTHWLPECVVA